MQENLVNLIPSNKLHNFFWCSYKVNEFDLENFLQSMGVRSLLSACTYSYTYVNMYIPLFIPLFNIKNYTSLCLHCCG